jgi:hypothetical protein
MNIPYHKSNSGYYVYRDTCASTQSDECVDMLRHQVQARTSTGYLYRYGKYRYHRYLYRCYRNATRTPSYFKNIQTFYLVVSRVNRNKYHDLCSNILHCAACTNKYGFFMKSVILSFSRFPQKYKSTFLYIHDLSLIY